jgi:hypothetical protein
MPSTFQRSTALVGMLAAAAIGLGSRLPMTEGVPILGPYGGDAAWTIAACAGIRLIRPTLPVLRIALLGYGLSVVVECSQLVHVDPLDEIRSHPLGALLLGRGFLWSDLVAYGVGAIVFGTVFRALDARYAVEDSSQPGRKEVESAGRNPPPSE